jgi:hypothetical protein
MLLFRSEEHVERWCRSRGIERGGTLSLEQVWELARAWYTPDRREPEWRRHTVQEAESLFRAVDLTSGFWALSPRA